LGGQSPEFCLYQSLLVRPLQGSGEDLFRRSGGKPDIQGIPLLEQTIYNGITKPIYSAIPSASHGGRSVKNQIHIYRTIPLIRPKKQPGENQPHKYQSQDVFFHKNPLYALFYSILSYFKNIYR
jgi:hypothetical protein